MKRKNRSKLSLHRETLHALEGAGLRRAAGGVTLAPSCRNPTCSGGPDCPTDYPNCGWSNQVSCPENCGTQSAACPGTTTATTTGTE